MRSPTPSPLPVSVECPPWSSEVLLGPRECPPWSLEVLLGPRAPGAVNAPWPVFLEPSTLVGRHFPLFSVAIFSKRCFFSEGGSLGGVLAVVVGGVVGRPFLSAMVPSSLALGGWSWIADFSTTVLSFLDLCLLSASCHEVVGQRGWRPFLLQPLMDSGHW